MKAAEDASTKRLLAAIKARGRVWKKRVRQAEGLSMNCDTHELSDEDVAVKLWRRHTLTGEAAFTCCVDCWRRAEQHNVRTKFEEDATNALLAEYDELA
jgi:hypothetical protein